MNDEQTENVVRALESMARNLEHLNHNVTRLLQIIEERLEDEEWNPTALKSTTLTSRK